MKKKNILFSALCSLMLGMSFANCAGDEEFKEISKNPDDGKRYNYVLNEGLWGSNNANITGFVYDEKTSTLNSMGDIYLGINKQQMGDVANAMIKEDANIYVVLNGSKYVARLSPDGCYENARYTFPEAEGAPRCIDVEDDYAYVTQYGGQVTKLNIKDMTLAGTFKGGDNLEGIVAKDGKLYVANSYKGINDFNNEVFVIDAKTMALEKTIKVAINPTKIYEIHDRIYVLSQGNYVDVPSVLQEIEPSTLKVHSIPKTENVSKITEGYNKLIYGVRTVNDENWNPTNSFFICTTKVNEVSETSFLNNVPEALKTSTIYLLEVDEETGFIYVGTSDYNTNGTIYQFDQNGKFLRQFDSGGINPSAMVFIN